MNPISRLVEPIANALEHGGAQGVRVGFENLADGLAFHVCEDGGIGMTPEQARPMP